MTVDLMFAAMEATWPPAATTRLGPWLLRDGKGGGKRVSAASLVGDYDPVTIAEAEAAMRGAGMRPLFQLGPSDAALDADLAAKNYQIIDPVVIYSGKLSDLSQTTPPLMTTFPHWPPLGISVDLWAEGDIGPARIDVMHRVLGPKCAILGRISDRAAGVVFVALHGRVAMVHALEVTKSMRRKGLARHILQAAALWAKSEGATDLGLAVTTANVAARALYASFGMQDVGQYHYRQL
jgi:GNAT superfamily N-acetyltransferase